MVSADPAQPFFSLLLPVKNSLPYLRDQVESIRGQDFADFEVVVVDGNSTDGSFEYLSGIASQDPRFVVHQTMPRGVYAGLNECCRRARGQWVLFTMSDDTLKPGALASVAKAIADPAARDAVLVHWNIDLIDEHGKTLLPGWRRMQSPRYWGNWLNRKHRRSGEEEYWRHVLFGSVYISLTEIAVRRSALEKSGGFHEKIGNWADIYWAAKLVRTGSVLHVPGCYATWRLRPGQTTDVGKSAKLAWNHLKLIRLAQSQDGDPRHASRYRRYRRAAMIISKQGGHLRFGSKVHLSPLTRVGISAIRVVAAVARKTGVSDIDFRLLAFRLLLPPAQGSERLG